MADPVDAAKAAIDKLANAGALWEVVEYAREKAHEVEGDEAVRAAEAKSVIKDYLAADDCSDFDDTDLDMHVADLLAQGLI